MIIILVNNNESHSLQRCHWILPVVTKDASSHLSLLLACEFLSRYKLTSLTHTSSSTDLMVNFYLDRDACRPSRCCLHLTKYDTNNWS